MRSKGHNDEMTLDPPVSITADNLAITGNCNWLDREARFLNDLALDRLDQGFADLNHTARERE